MCHDELLYRITIDPSVCNGKPCIRGHRIWVDLIVGALAAGETVEGLLEAYPSIERDDIFACVAYDSETLHNRCMEIEP